MEFTKYKIKSDGRVHLLTLATDKIEVARYEIRKKLGVKRLPESIEIF